MAAADLRARAGKNMVFGAVAAIVGAVLTMWSNRGIGDIGLSVTQIIYWALIGGGALELAVGVFQLFQAREVLEGRMPIPRAILESNAQVADLARKIDVKGEIEVTLAPARSPHFAWGVVGVSLGLVFALLFGGAGTIIGGLFLLWAGYHLVRLALTLTRKPQTIRVAEDGLRLPRGLFGDECASLAAADIKHTYWLRHSAPWPHARPVLVVDLGEEALLYPRDWFASDHDQELIAAALRGRIAAG
jgi:hypothetical protein